MTYWNELLELILNVENLTSLMVYLVPSSDPIPNSQVDCILQVDSEQHWLLPAHLELISPAVVVALAVVVVVVSVWWFAESDHTVVVVLLSAEPSSLVVVVALGCPVPHCCLYQVVVVVCRLFDHHYPHLV